MFCRGMIRARSDNGSYLAVEHLDPKHCMSILACRPLLARTLQSLKPGWKYEPALGRVLLTRLLHDLHSTVAAGVAVSVESQKRFLRLCSCIDAILEGCRATSGSELAGNTVMSTPLHAAQPSLAMSNCRVGSITDPLWSTTNS